MTATRIVPIPPMEVDGPIRAELFGAERLEQHAESLAAAQVVARDSRQGHPLISRVSENGRALLEYYQAVVEEIQREQPITPAAEWLVDNFYVVEEQLREIRDDLPPSFYEELPKLTEGHLKGYPRVYGIAWAFVAHTDSRFDPDLLKRFVNAYQRVQPLNIGELWAIAITLRIVLVENLRRIAEATVLSRRARDEANQLADSLLGTGGQLAVDPATVLRRFENKPLNRAFAVQLVRRLRDLDPKVGPILIWLDERLDAQGATADEIVRAEHQDQATLTVTVRNVITSMRMTSAFDWPVFFESVSLVDQILREGSQFGQMDFDTRDVYRHAIEDLSKGAKLPEIEIAQRAVQRARRANSNGNGHAPSEAVTDPGYYLISHGRREFERELGFKVPWRRWLLRQYVRAAVPGYLGTIFLLTALILLLPLAAAWEAGVSLKVLILQAFLAAIPASDLAIALVNRAVTNLLGPRTLPRFEFPQGIPAQLRSMVVVPTLLIRPESIKEQVDRLEVHYLANSDGDLRFALLSDWVDATAEAAPDDDALLAVAVNGIAALNQRYGPAPGGGSRFLLYHRKRVWNECQRCWMGWERKRGKLHELNLLLRGATDTTFIPVAGSEPEKVPGVRYAITLDADTRLPRGSAARLIGTMAHPLNRPRYSESEGRVVDGYSIVQPRIMATLSADGEGSWYQRISSGDSGIDPYASAVSDVYQDLFHEGSFTGKGIYDIDMFEKAMADNVEENSLLSHDLLEGILARAALATDIELFEEFPTHYEAAAARQHRWVRGDWQLLPWLFGKAGKSHIHIPAISRWKILDNFRRSLLAPTLFLTLLVGWLLPGSSTLTWTRFVLTVIGIPALLPFLFGLAPRRGGISKRSHLQGALSDLGISLAQIGMTVTFLAYQTWVMADAIFRTLARMLCTHRNLLQWVSAAQAKHGVDLKLLGSFRRMAGGVALAAAAFAIIAMARPASFAPAMPFIVLWAASPAIARWISSPRHPIEVEPLSASAIQNLRLAARRTWRFFETFVTEEDHWLPPDNFQETPKPVVAHRTSPTNIGLYLLSTIAARDFGWIGALENLDRVEATLGAIGRMETHRGHLYNWYETLTLQPLLPKYISSVDSGNLAGNLLVLTNDFRELGRQSSTQRSIVRGMIDAILLLREAVAGAADTRRTHIVTFKQLNNAVRHLAASLVPFPVSSMDWAVRIAEWRKLAQTLEDITVALAQEQGAESGSELCAWAVAVRKCVESHARDFEILVPWLRLPAEEIPLIAARFFQQTPEWSAIEHLFQTVPSLADAPEVFDSARKELAVLRQRAAAANLPAAPRADVALIARIDALDRALADSSSEASALIRRLVNVARTAERMFVEMDFKFLFDEPRKLFSLGYRVSDGALDFNCYDLLASESRLTSFIAIAKGDVPVAHWFRLDRPLTPVGHGSALISWSGSMFEYLMPALVMRSPGGSLLSQTYEQVVRRQVEYGNERHVPWGVSESAFNARDLDMTYQYSAFGVPGLGLKRGLSDDVVTAPYATALAAMVKPAAAVRNLNRIAAAGGRGRYGFYEALDYTPSRVPEGANVAVVQAYMAHHQGMSLVAFDNVLDDAGMRNRFHAEPIVQATELLLQERTPRDALISRPREEEVSGAAAMVRQFLPPVVRRFTTPHDRVPRTQLLSNGRYLVMLTSAGSGYSRWRDVAVTRWREDVTRDCWGSYIFLRDMQSGEFWSTGHQPVCADADQYEVTFFEDHAEFSRRDRSIATTMEVVVSSEDDAEVRRLSITNLGARAHDIQVTSYMELVLASQASDVAHPAFSNLFVQTEYDADTGVLLATRRPRSDDEPPIWAAHLLFTEAKTVGDLQYETNRAKFIGRGRSLRDAVSIVDGSPLCETVGSVLDPIFSLRRTVHVEAGSTVHLFFTTIASDSREHVLDVADKYRDATAFGRTVTLAWTQAQVQFHHLAIDADEANLFQRLANAVIYSDPSLRPSSEELSRSRLELPTLWAQGISGDLPIVLARIDSSDEIDLIRQLLRAHEYWRMKQLAADVVIINEKPSSYQQDLQSSLEALVHGSQLRLSPDSASRGHIFLLRGDQLPPDTRIQLQNIARIVLLSRRGTLAEQIVRTQARDVPVASPARPARPGKRMDTPIPEVPLEFFNGLGGFAENGREYVVTLGEGLRTPEPWVNVIANPSFGFLVSESGSGFTWSINSHENQITPWSNDHLMDTPGEVIYIRDENSGEVWTPTALPIRDEVSPYVVSHGQGYSRFRHGSHGILATLVEYVPVGDSVKISRLTLQNNSGRARRLSVTAYVEWVLGPARAANAPYLVTELDNPTRAVFARNSWNNEYAGRVAFADLRGAQSSYTADRTEFLGRNGSPSRPAALDRGGALSGKTGAGLDPCAALQTAFELRPGAQIEIVFFVGEAESREQARDLIGKYRAADLDAVLRDVIGQWDDVLGAIQIRTPDRSMDMLFNRWLLYQALSCRIWGRAAFYQLSGAYGFRDQLQDVMALAIARPEIAREHILRAASRQFITGDVQHWWHPPAGQGVRTRISDDRVWLPYAVVHYLEATGDASILNEEVPFLEGEPLGEDQLESYFLPVVSQTKASLFEHCARALDCSLALGSHSLPLMGTGDWNDGMNRVGVKGKGESVWLAWFLHTVLWEFAKIADGRGEQKRAETWRLHVSTLKVALEREAWDGKWYRRAFFDDGTPLGSEQNSECRIDSIAQTWGVLSGGADASRAARAMAAADQQLVRRPEGLLLLLTPPFDKMTPDPGYIRSYVSGIRENGGHYTHAAVWNVLAFAALGDGEKAAELFRMLNPIERTKSRADIQRYKVEPYVMVGDIYAEPPHVGRGGWTWYTGSAGWMYRAGIEWILGFRVRGATLNLDPSIPRGWRSYSVTFRYHSATYNVTVENPHGVPRGVVSLTVDGASLQPYAPIPLAGDGREHQVTVVLGAGSAGS